MKQITEECLVQMVRRGVVSSEELVKSFVDLTGQKIKTAYLLENLPFTYSRFLSKIFLLHLRIDVVHNETFCENIKFEYPSGFVLMARYSNGRIEVLIKATGLLPIIPAKVLPKLRVLLLNYGVDIYLSVKLKWMKATGGFEFPMPIPGNDFGATTIIYKAKVANNNMGLSELRYYLNQSLCQFFSYIVFGSKFKEIDGDIEEKRLATDIDGREIVYFSTCPCQKNNCIGSFEFMKHMPCTHAVSDSNKKP